MNIHPISLQVMILGVFLYVSTGYFPYTHSAHISLPLHDSTLSLPDREAQFPGGAKAWAYYLNKNLNADIPARNNAPVGSYTVVVKFIVEKDGRVTGITPTTRFGYGMEAELTRIIQNGPHWIPARLKGRNVKAYRRQPVTFVVTEK